MESAPAAEPAASRDVARLNKILNGLNTQVRAIETPAVGITRPVRAADAIRDMLNKIRAGLNKIVICLNTRRVTRLGTLNTIAMARERARRVPPVAVPFRLVGGACSRVPLRRGCGQRAGA